MSASESICEFYKEMGGVSPQSKSQKDMRAKVRAVRQELTKCAHRYERMIHEHKGSTATADVLYAKYDTTMWAIHIIDATFGDLEGKVGQ